MFYVKSWDTDEVLSEHEALPIARRYCRGEGHTGDNNGRNNGRWYLPVAYVANETGDLVYNPRFSMNVSGTVTGAFHAHDDNLR